MFMPLSMTGQVFTQAIEGRKGAGAPVSGEALTPGSGAVDFPMPFDPRRGSERQCCSGHATRKHRPPGLAEASTNVGAGADGAGPTSTGEARRQGSNALADGASRRTSWQWSRLWQRTSAVKEP